MEKLLVIPTIYLIDIATRIAPEKSLHRCCPNCKIGRLLRLLTFDNCGSPLNLKQLIKRKLQKYNAS